MLAEEITRLGAEHAWIVGGEAAVSPTVVDALTDLGITDTTRLAGATRYDTALEVATYLQGPEPGHGVEVYLVRGDGGDNWSAATAVATNAIRSRLLTPDNVLPPKCWNGRTTVPAK